MKHRAEINERKMRKTWKKRFVPMMRVYEHRSIACKNG